MSIILEKLGDYNEAKILILTELINTKNYFGLDHPLYATSLNIYSKILNRLGDY